jgi:CheY-like chemotaxis protein
MSDPRPPGSVRRVVCLDDDQDNCELLTFLLEQSGYEVITTTSDGEAFST